MDGFKPGKARRRIALAGALVALLGMPAAAQAATSATGDQSVTGDVADTLEATFPSAYAWGNLNAGSAGNESAEQSLTVKSNKAWGVKISSDIAAGKMTEFDGTAYVALSPKILTNALQWRLSSLAGTAQSTTYAAISSTQASLTTGQAATSDTGTAVGTKFKQVISYSDVSAGATNDYRILGKYDVAQGY